jgi:cytidylate kinase
MADAPVITVDGPSGTGKGTICLQLAALLGWHFLDSGVLYRALALAALRAGQSLENTPELCRLAEQLDIRFTPDITGKHVAIWLDQTEVTARIRTEECGNAASKIAVYPGVRAGLLSRQRAFRQAPGLVADGRDMGTVVFPDATLKIYLTASAEERAKRRYKQLKEQGFSVNLARLSAEIAERDERDAQRSASPLTPASNAIIIDTTAVNAEAVGLQVLDLVRKNFPELTGQLPIN